MNELFLKIINMSISASWLVLAVLILRLALQKAPKWIRVLLGSIVAVRLICPFSIESALSLIPSEETIPMNIEMAANPAIDSGINIVNHVINPAIAASFTPNPETSANPLQIWIPLAAFLWIVGVVLMLLYTTVSYWNLRRRVNTAVLYKNNIFQSEIVASPFVLGIIKPKIYLPFDMYEQDLEHVVAHEQAHIQRKDYLWKPLGFLLLTIHWFNPLMWIAYILLCRDIELACDEKVIKELGKEQRADYTQALVACSVNRRMIAACPLAFGEIGVKERVKSVMNYKKPAFWTIVFAMIACTVVAVCFLTNPKSLSELPASEDESELITEEINVETRDITHDGIEDYIVTSMSYDTSIVATGASLQERINQQIFYDVVTVKIYEGKQNADTYSDKNLLWNQDYSRVHVGNGQMSIVQVDGKDYVLTSSLYGGQGSATWKYEVFSLNAVGNRNIIAAQSVAFEIDTEESKGKIEEFKELISHYINNGILIVACDIDFEEQWIRSREISYCPQDYYNYAFVKYNDTQSEEVPRQETDGEIAEVQRELDRIVSSIGLENAYPWNSTVEFEIDTGALIKMANDETERFEIYGIMTEKYGTYGLLLVDWIGGEQNCNFAYVPWHYSGAPSDQPILESDGSGKYVFAYVYKYEDGVPQMKEGILDCGYDTGHMELLLQEEMKTTVAQGVRIAPSSIASIIITNGNTGEKKTLTGAEVYSEEYYFYNDLIKLYGQLDFSVQAVENERVGYQYSMALYDAEGNKLQIITPYKDGLTVDWRFYQYDDTGEGAKASLRLMEYMEYVFSSKQTSMETPLTEIAVNSLPNVTMMMEKYKAWEGDIEIFNLTENEFQTGEWYNIQKWENGEWHRVEQKIDAVWKQVAYQLPEKETTALPTNWKVLYGELSTGKYRILKEVYEISESRTDKHYLAVEFEIQ